MEDLKQGEDAGVDQEEASRREWGAAWKSASEDLRKDPPKSFY